MRSARTYSFIHPAIVVLACTLPGLSAMAAPMDVHTRNLDGTTDNLGRGGGSFYTDQRDAGLEAQQSEAGKAAWDKTKADAERAWDKTKAVATQPPAVSPDEPQRYGRAG